MATHFKTSLQEAAIGYVLALLVGLPLGLAMAGSKWPKAVPPHFRTHPAHPAHRVDSPHRVLVRHRSDRQGVHHLDRGHCACVINAYVGVRMTSPVLIQMPEPTGQ